MPSVEDALLSWPDWNVPWSTAPRLERKLAGGSTNESYLISADDRNWVLRLNGQNSVSFGIDRKLESTIIECAAAGGIAPAIAYCSIERGLLVTEFIHGRHWQLGALDDPEHLAQLLDLVRAVHTLEVDTPPIDYYAHAEHYWAALVDNQIDIPQTLHHERDQLLEQREINPIIIQSTHLCHHDLNPSNIIDQNGRLYLLDWEYAAHGSRAFDYAAVATEWGVPLEHLQEHLDIDLAELTDAAKLYLYICRLWFLLNDGNEVT